MKGCAMQEICNGSSQNEQHTADICCQCASGCTAYSQDSAAGHKQQHWCQQLAVIPLLHQKNIKLWDYIYTVSVSDKGKGKISMYWKLKRNLIFVCFFVFILKKQYQPQMAEADGKFKKYCRKVMGYLLSGLVLYLVCIPNIFINSNQ